MMSRGARRAARTTTQPRPGPAADGSPGRLKWCASSVASPNRSLPEERITSHISSNPGMPPPPRLFTIGWPLKISKSLSLRDPGDVGGGDRPAEVRVVEMRGAVGSADVVDVLLQRLDDRGAPRRLHHAIDRQPVDVERLPSHRVGDFFTGNDEELVVGAEECVEPVDRGEEVVVGEDEELVAVLAIPAGHVVGRRVAVGVERVGVRVPLVPAQRLARAPLGVRRSGKEGQDSDDA